jgi:hypothetical protein
MHSEPATSPAGRRSVLHRLMSVLRGDKYMVGAYPPDWAASSTRPDEVPRGGGAATPSQER